MFKRIRPCRRKGRWFIVLIGALSLALLTYVDVVKDTLLTPSPGISPAVFEAQVAASTSGRRTTYAPPFQRPTLLPRVQRRTGLGVSNFSWGFVPDIFGVPELRLLESGLPYDHDHARTRSCMHRKHIVFLGDSLLRYQYLNFVQWLRSGNWTTSRPRLEHTGDWVVQDKDWNLFFNRSSNTLSAPQDGVFEYCDCYRVPDKHSNWEEIADNALEQRFFRDVHAGLRVSYVQMFGGWPMHGHNLSWLGVDVPGSCGDLVAPSSVCAPQSGCEPGSPTCGRAVEPWHWTARFPDTAFDVLPNLFRPDDVPFAIITNQGLWGCPGNIAPQLLEASARCILRELSPVKLLKALAYPHSITNQLQLYAATLTGLPALMMT